MVDLQTISLIAQIVGVSATAIAAVVGVNSYINSNRRAEETRKRELETRQAQLLNSIYQQQISEGMKKAVWAIQNVEIHDLNDWKNIVKDGEKIAALDMLVDYYDGVGVFVRENFLDIRLVAQLMGGTVILFWENFGGGLRAMRIENNFPRAAYETEYLYYRLKDFGGKHPEMLLTSPSHDTFMSKAISSQ